MELRTRVHVEGSSLVLGRGLTLIAFAGSLIASVVLGGVATTHPGALASFLTALGVLALSGAALYASLRTPTVTVRADASGLRVGDLVVPAERLLAGFYFPRNGYRAQHVVVQRTDGAPIAVDVEDETRADALLRALGLDADHRATSFPATLPWPEQLDLRKQLAVAIMATFALGIATVAPQALVAFLAALTIVAGLARRATVHVGIDGVLVRTQSGTFARPAARTHFWPYIFAGAYHRARGGSVSSWSFTELPHWSLRYTAGHAPPEHAPFWIFDPCAYDYDRDGAYHDYVLVNGDEKPFDDDPPGPRFEPVATSGAMTLYAKTRASFEPSGEAIGPCSRAAKTASR